MAIYNPSDLEIIGICGRYPAETTIPKVASPIFRIKATGEVITCKSLTDSGEVESDDFMSAAEWALYEEDDDTYTKLGPFQAIVNGIPFVGLTRIDYVNSSEALGRFQRFSEATRRAGDHFYRKGDKDRALEFYFRCSGASQTEEDFARVLLCELDNEMREHLKRVIIQLGKDPAEVVRDLTTRLNQI